MKQNRWYRRGIAFLLPALVLPLFLLAADPPERVKVQYKGEEYPAHYETLLGRFDGN